MPRNLLSEVDVVAISLVDKGANRKRFYLRKQDEGEDLITLPASHRLIKATDWSTVYCVVAEPGWEENPGRNAGDPNVSDVWKDADEIRIAAHKFMANGALVNKMHETLDPYGRVVENFISPIDFMVNGEVIKEGSWVVGIQPSDEGKAKIDSGEFTGISIQGSGVRTLEKEEVVESNEVAEAQQTFFQKFAEFLKGNPVETETATVSKGDTDVSDQTKTDTTTTTDSDRLAKVEESVEKTNKELSSLAQSVAQIAQTLAEKSGDQATDPAQEVYHRLDEVTKSLGDIREDVEKLAQGGTTQPDNGSNGSVQKSDDPLSGVLFGD